jgi:hypothetical protein
MEVWVFIVAGIVVLLLYQVYVSYNYEPYYRSYGMRMQGGGKQCGCVIRCKCAPRSRCDSKSGVTAANPREMKNVPSTWCQRSDHGVDSLGAHNSEFTAGMITPIPTVHKTKCNLEKFEKAKKMQHKAYSMPFDK